MSLLGGAGLTGDIWSTGAFSFESPLKDLLDSGDYTLEQLLAEDELLQELRGLHPTLIEYFAQEQSVKKLIRYITLPHAQVAPEVEEKGENGDAAEDEVEGVTQPNSTESVETGAQRVTRQLEKRKSGDKTTAPENDPEFKHIRFPYMACEIICCEIDGILNTLVDGYVKEDESQNGDIVTNEDDEHVEVVERKPVRLLDLFFNVLYDTPAGQLDDYRAGYFDKILSILFRKRSQDLSTYINTGGSLGQESLMEAMMKHLYSHSIMQICQRLLLPPRPTPKPGEDGEELADGEQLPDGEGGDEDGIGGQDILPGEEDDEDTNGIGIKCDWSKSGKAIEMLLVRLMNPETLLETDAQVSPASAVDTNQSIDEQRLSLSLNASEVLITVIQNSMLSSETMLSLTSLETMERLTAASTKLADGEGFSLHESLLTSAMNVVESLILQLGGYGAVGTMSILDSDGQEQPDGSGGEEGAQPQNTMENEPLIADLESLLEVLPVMLQGFSDLLRHPSTKEWKAAVQFSKTEPVQLLGTSRLRIVRVLESLVLLGDPSVDSKLVQSDCLLICLDLFWEFQWCSMLHQSVANLLVHVFEGQNVRFEIQEYFISKCQLIGRLMNSFIEVNDPRVHNMVMDLDKVIDTTETKLSESKDDTAGALPVSEDDIDAALENQEDEENESEGPEAGAEQSPATPLGENVEMASTEAVNQESRDASTVGVSAPAQSFRFGYMGHVIIICQALVQACAANEWAAEQAEAEQAEAEIENHAPSDGGTSEPPSVSDAGGDETVKTGDPIYEPLWIAELVNNHELAERWQEFVISILASEIAVQSTPLGGLNAQPTDPLQSHRPEVLGRRPGPADDGDIGDDAMAPPPPRGMVGASDLDENDLEVAASMMAGLNLGLRLPDDDNKSEGEYSGDADSRDSGDSQRSYNSGETNNSNEGYLFDDPLGKDGGALGIELGKLPKYRPSPGEKKVADNDGNDSSDDSSSDEEPRREDDDDDEDPPVMDLFAGNFNQASPGDAQPDAFDFANFDNAFEGGAAADAFGDFESAPASDLADSSAVVPEKNDVDEIFGGSASLLDELDDLPPLPQQEEQETDGTSPVEESPNEGNATDGPVEVVATEEPVSITKEEVEEPVVNGEPIADAEDPIEGDPTRKTPTGETLVAPPSEVAADDKPQKEGVLVS
uniref:Uncharacterized protein n=1 Tax=Entomoneis paludosa TaxID=265537 RepID=A0A7S2YQH3_9STRA|mmetsp:Transcript_5709/g.12051  ORF Transcript_5709/g.12051 Transcript_5709/m.12051 type:complete len:1179 (+) Transcript_5709:196-3732(+)|eukprot:CAMPEP_0172459330 /NCGR_PEP_ID=MMETSP1065-20121228/32088_1 /TAXON_ID=265537 /ORGANISM="Amphiprora paludosa, Strain CCMP125" /LENGTH=1178 /DNA_ID=CAMNT_0013213963 /DNA_START=58 /DNA_END=3594 /DNA_ORIENTATION=-